MKNGEVIGTTLHQTCVFVTILINWRIIMDENKSHMVITLQVRLMPTEVITTAHSVVLNMVFHVQK